MEAKASQRTQPRPGDVPRHGWASASAHRRLTAGEERLHADIEVRTNECAVGALWSTQRPKTVGTATSVTIVMITMKSRLAAKPARSMSGIRIRPVP